MQICVTQENAGDNHDLPPVVSVVVAMVTGVMRRWPVVLLPPEQATQPTHGTPVVRASRQEPCEGAAVPVVSVVLGRRRVVMPVAVAGLFLALDLVLDGVGHRGPGCAAQERLEFAPVAHLMADCAACTTADNSSHQTLLAVLCLPWLAVIVWL